MRVWWAAGLGWADCEGSRESVRSSYSSCVWAGVYDRSHLITWYFVPYAKKIRPTPALTLYGYCTMVKLVCDRHTTKKLLFSTSFCFIGLRS